MRVMGWAPCMDMTPVWFLGAERCMIERVVSSAMWGERLGMKRGERERVSRGAESDGGWLIQSG